MTKRTVSILIALMMVCAMLPIFSAQAATDLAPVEMDWYIGLNPMPDNQMVTDALNEYLKDKINLKLNIFFWPSADWETKVTTMVSSGQDMGILGFGSQSKLDYVIQSNRGAFYPIDDLLAEYGTGTKALFSDGVWDAMKINGHIYGIPSLKDNCYIISVVYNDEMAQEFGINIDDYKYSNWRDLDDLLYLAKEKRDAKDPAIVEPIAWESGLEMPYNFALETFLNDSFMAVCNVPGIDDIAGYDSHEVFNLYGTQEYRDFAKQMQKRVEDGIEAYTYQDKTEWMYTGDMFAYVGWGYTYMQQHLYGENFTTKMKVSDHIWTDTNNYFSAGTAISAANANPERAMMFLEMVNTDPFVATMMRFGIEGKHHVFDDQGKMQFAGSERNGGARADYGYYYWYAAPIGNLTIVNAPEALTGPDAIMLKEIVRYNKEAKLPSHMGFVFNVAPVSAEIAACTNVVMEYRDMIRGGRIDSGEDVDGVVDEFNEKLKANGVETIVAEVQKQIDAWEAAK